MAQLAQPHPQPPLPDFLSFIIERIANASTANSINITMMLPMFALKNAAI
jgi:hypothetical protein